MKLLDGPDYYGATIFCDDVRQEVGGKVTLVGMYMDRMFVHGDFPFLLPKFAMYINCIQRQRVAKPITKFVIFLPGDEDDKPSIEVLHAPDQMVSLLAEDENKMPEHGIIKAHASIMLSPVVFQAPGEVKVRAIIQNDQMIRCGVLPIERHPSALATPPAG